MKTKVFLSIAMLLSTVHINASENGGLLAKITNSMPACPLSDAQKQFAKDTALTGAKVLAVAAATKLAVDNLGLVTNGASSVLNVATKRTPNMVVKAGEHVCNHARASLPQATTGALGLFGKALSHDAFPILAGIGYTQQERLATIVTKAKELVTPENLSNAASLTGAFLLARAALGRGSIEEGVAGALLVACSVKTSSARDMFIQEEAVAPEVSMAPAAPVVAEATPSKDNTAN